MYGDFSSEEVSKAMGDTSKVSVLMVDGLDLSAIKNLNMKNSCIQLLVHSYNFRGGGGVKNHSSSKGWKPQ